METDTLPEPARTGPIPDYQRHNIASCAAAGYPIERIALATGLPEETIKRQLRDPNEHMQQLLAHYRFQQNAIMVKFKMETATLVDEGLRVMKRCMTQEKDMRLAWDVSKDLLSVHGLVFPRDRAGASQVNTQINLMDEKAIQAMGQVAESVRTSTEMLRNSLPKASSILDNPHIHASRAEIVEATPTTQQTAQGEGNERDGPGP